MFFLFFYTLYEKEFRVGYKKESLEKKLTKILVRKISQNLYNFEQP